MRNVLETPSEADIRIFDRSPLDVIAYTLHAGRHEPEAVQTLIQDIVVLFKAFDRVFLLRPDGDWPTNCNPSEEDIEFARYVDNRMIEAVERFSLQVRSLPWSMDERARILCPPH